MRLRGVSALLGVLLLTTPAGASDVVVWGEALSGMDLNRINNFYNSLAGTTSTLESGELDTVDLTGIELLWAVQPADAYTPAEVAAMADFLAGGGRIAFMGEHGTFAPDQNDRISAALSTLGANISINNLLIDAGFRQASVGDGQILAHALTAGVNTYQYAAFAPLTIGGTAEALMLGEGLDTVMMAYQNIGPGSVFLITDQNVWDNQPSGWPGFDNATMFENLLLADTGAPPPDTSVPEPTSLALFGLGLAAVGVLRRR